MTTSRRSVPSPHSAATWPASASAIGELAAARPVGADEIGVAEIAWAVAPVLLAPAPQIAAGKAQEHRAAARLHALALQRQEGFLDRVGSCGAA